MIILRGQIMSVFLIKLKVIIYILIKLINYTKYIITNLI